MTPRTPHGSLPAQSSVPPEPPSRFQTPDPDHDVLGGPGAGKGCPSELLLADQALSGTQMLQATASVTLGENLVIDGDSIDVKAPIVAIVGGTSISNPFSIGNTPSCP